jgi:Rhodopirellula transposase DDE domain
VDTKKKELAGNYHNGGREWRPAGDPVRVKSHDFPDLELGKAIPYGIYDLAADTGWVNARHRSRHRRFRCGVDPPLVERRGPGRLPGRPAATDHR